MAGRGLASPFPCLASWCCHQVDVDVGCWLGIQPYLWAGDFSSSWGRPLHSVLGLPHIMVAGFQEKWCWWNKIEMHAFLWAGLSNHIASLLLFFIAQGSHRRLGFKGRVIDFTTQWGVSSHTERRTCWIWDVVIAIFANKVVGYTPPDLSVPTILLQFWAADLYALYLKWFLHPLPFPWVPPIRRSEGERTVSMG